jgi:imidazolonepropionase-like amidohydrolase
MRKTLAKGAGALLLALMASAAPAQTIAITGGTVALGDGSEPIPGGTVIISNGRIVSAGSGVAVPPGAQIVDATGKWVTPGIMAGFSRVGLAEVDAVDATNDVQANNSPFSAAIDVAPAINPRAAAISISRAAGVTRAVVAPGTGKSIFAGQGAVIDLGADMQPITRARAFQFVEFGRRAQAAPAGAERRPSSFSETRFARLATSAATRQVSPAAARKGSPGRTTSAICRSRKCPVRTSRCSDRTSAARRTFSSPASTLQPWCRSWLDASCSSSMSNAPVTSFRCWASSASFRI